MLKKLQKRLERAAVVAVVATSLFPASAAFSATAPAVTVLSPPVTENVDNPVAVAFDPRGFFFVADPRMNGISKFDLTGKLIQVLKVNLPGGVALNDKGNLLVSQGDAVVILDPNTGAQLGTLGSGRGQFQQAAGIAVDIRGYVFVADAAANTIKVFTSAGQPVQTIGSKGGAKGQFSFPTGLAYDRTDDQIIVADTRNARVQFFSATGNYSFVKTIGSFGTDPLQFKSPAGIALEYNAAGIRMYVADLYQNRVQVIDPADSGTFLSYIGGSGLVNGLLMVPMDVAFDTANRRIVVANGNGHLQLFGIDGGSNPVAGQGLTLDPVTATTTTSSITITGSVPANTTVSVSASGAAAVAPVSYTSSTTWKCIITNLAAGSNVITAAATVNGAVMKQSVGIVYSP